MIKVVAGVALDAQGHVLIAKRHRDSHQGGLWEFPGGKIKPGERPIEALTRELTEELGITVVKARPLITIDHDYGDKQVNLDVWAVVGWVGEARGCEGQAIQWTKVNELDENAFPAANVAIVRAVKLSPLYVISPQSVDHEERFLKRLESVFNAGVRLLQLRLPTWERQRLIRFSQAVAKVCRRHNARFLVNGDPADIELLKADGIHLNGLRLKKLQARPLDRGHLVAASVHNLEQLRHAESIDVDFTVIGPVLPTTSHPAATPLGWGQFARLARSSVRPAYALGGLSLAEMDHAWCQGAQGLAMISAVWDDDQALQKIQALNLIRAS